MRSLLGRAFRAAWALGLVSMFMDISSEMIHALMPIYLVNVLGTSTLTVGIIEGIAEATASTIGWDAARTWSPLVTGLLP